MRRSGCAVLRSLKKDRIKLQCLYLELLKELQIFSSFFICCQHICIASKWFFSRPFYFSFWALATLHLISDGPWDYFTSVRSDNRHNDIKGDNKKKDTGGLVQPIRLKGSEGKWDRGQQRKRRKNMTHHCLANKQEPKWVCQKVLGNFFNCDGSNFHFLKHIWIFGTFRTYSTFRTN